MQSPIIQQEVQLDIAENLKEFRVTIITYLYMCLEHNCLLKWGVDVHSVVEDNVWWPRITEVALY